MPTARAIIWRARWVEIGTLVALRWLSAWTDLLAMLFVAFLFGIAMEPAFNHLHMRRGMKRGAATVVVLLLTAVLALGILLIVIPGLVALADEIGNSVQKAIPSINDTFGTNIPTSATDPAYDQAQQNVEEWIKSHTDEILQFASGTIGFIFDLFTIAMFSFYFAADRPRVRRAVLRRFPPARQERLGWSWDTAVQQTGGYFYSKILPMFINGGCFFFVMVLVGVDSELALPLSIFEGFVAAFIPAIGTYMGAAVPIVVTWGIVGFQAALILLVWMLIYQSLES